MTTPTNESTAEPVMWTAAVTSLLGAGATALALFHVVNLTNDQIAGAVGLVTACTPFIGFLLRRRVSPVAK